jgi:hypothetical protein
MIPPVRVVGAGLVTFESPGLRGTTVPIVRGYVNGTAEGERYRAAVWPIWIRLAVLDIFQLRPNRSPPGSEAKAGSEAASRIAE